LPCEGENITGEGATVQEAAEEGAWIPGFKAHTCTGIEPTITFKAVSQGPALESWGVSKHAATFGPTDAFLATDEGPDQTDRGEIEAGETVVTGEGKVMEIPVAQVAEAIVVNLPTGCTAKSQPAKKEKLTRLVLSNSLLEQIFEGTATWTEFKEGKDKLKCVGKEAKTAEKGLITRVARAEGAGATSILQRYLEIEMEAKGRLGEKLDNGKSWDENAALAKNTNWPNESSNPVIRAAKSSGEATEVSTHPGTIGYVTLPSARAKFGAGGSTFWVQLENGPGKYAEPSSNGFTTTVADSNCTETPYTNGTKKFPPATVYLPWNEVTTALETPNYSLCGLTYVVALKKYNDYPLTTAKEARTVYDYVNYILSTGPNGGQTAIHEGHDYEALTSQLQSIGVAGASEITFE